jgi:hypothetical protein
MLQCDLLLRWPLAGQYGEVVSIRSARSLRFPSFANGLRQSVTLQRPYASISDGYY